MIFRKFAALTSAIVLALASLFTLAFSGEAQASGVTLYWCEFSSNSDFNTSSNWNTNSSCSGGTNEVPVSGDALVFDNTHLNSSLDITNDISGLDISSITFQGNGSGGYGLSGDSLSLDSGLTDSGSGGQTNTLNLGLSLTASQSFDVSGNDSLQILGNLNLNSYNLVLTPGVSELAGTISGSGGLTFDSPLSGVATYTLDGANSSLSGPITINSKAAVIDNSGSLNALGTGAITIASGGSLTLKDATTTGTFTNPLNLSGSGDGTANFGAIISCLGLNSTCTSSNTKLTLSGNVTLSSDTELVNGAYTSGESSPPTYSATFDFTGDIIYNNYTLTAVPNSNTVVDLPALNNSSSSSKAPGSPDTGVGLSSSSPLTALAGGTLIASTIVITGALARKLSKKNHG